MESVNVIITAPKGKMGKFIVKVASERKDMRIIATLGPNGRDYIGKDSGIVAGIGYETGALVIDNLESIINGKPAIEQCDVIIDFSTIELSLEIIELAKKYNKAFICGTTGFSSEQKEYMQKLSQEMPLMIAANTSFLVNLMKELLKISSRALGEKADIEIIDMHDKYKKDAPSGTAKELGEVIGKSSGIEIRPSAYHSVRSGNIPSTHTVIFGCMGERLEITHHSYDWECFARGACEAAIYMKDKQNGLYEMEDIL
ncbi:MAG: 4-hydroxy-tetrahydrodipicolinate reductase [Clostridioides sp.]|jgi:4-hydroxy-tetrahydrodipicolinate reductase|nr:4-hydroxy-tetrahydrodipicolinate reductase [Clostridioides sp.]